MVLERDLSRDDVILRFCMIVAAIVSIGLSSAAANSRSLPAWMLIRPHALAYLEDEGDGVDPPPGRRTVCQNLWAYRHRDETDGARECPLRHAFGLVRIDRIVGYVATIGTERLPIVAITSVAERWSGVVIGLALEPLVARGARLVLERGAVCSRSSIVAFAPDNAVRDGFALREKTTVEVLRQHAPDNAHYPIYVRILAGPHRNERVWTLLFTAPNGAFWMQDPTDIVP